MSSRHNSMKYKNREKESHIYKTQEYAVQDWRKRISCLQDTRVCSTRLEKGISFLQNTRVCSTRLEKKNLISTRHKSVQYKIREKESHFYKTQEYAV